MWPRFVIALKHVSVNHRRHTHWRFAAHIYDLVSPTKPELSRHGIHHPFFMRKTPNCVNARHYGYFDRLL